MSVQVVKPAIFNAKSLSVADAVSPVPTMRSTLLGWFRQLELVKVVKKTVGVRTVEVEVPLPALGVWQPLSAEELNLKKEGERSWRWFSITASTDLVLLTDDIIARSGVRYRVMGKWDYTDEGFVTYHVINAFDLKGGGP